MPSITAESLDQVDLAIEERREACGFCRGPFSEAANTNARRIGSATGERFVFINARVKNGSLNEEKRPSCHRIFTDSFAKVGEIYRPMFLLSYNSVSRKSIGQRFVHYFKYR